MSSHTILLVTPSVQRPRARDDSSVPGPASDLRHSQSNEPLDPPRRGVSRLVPVPQLAIHAPAPGVQIPIRCYCCRVVRSTRHLHDHLPHEGLRYTRDVFPPVVSVAQTAVVPPAPRIDLTVRGEDDGVAGPACNLRNSDPAESVNICGLVLVTRVTNSQLTVLAPPPAEYCQTPIVMSEPAAAATTPPELSAASTSRAPLLPSAGTARFSEGATSRDRGGGSAGA
mmetsp:Transcript_11452/g.33764  ORF Transcript_11452/g.33764 Transcript_11452/m.33764 type:complete len:226 (+) Transcript_11452:1516-2193(+)